MEAHRRTWFDARGLIVAGPAGERPLPFYAGAMHYWHVDPARWAACLKQIHEAGLTIVDTVIPWRVHEPTAGDFEWSGANDLSRFLELARAAGLAVVVRPGPQASAELTCFGLPDHVVGDPACQARSARGTPVWMPSPPRAWPVPSYASTAFRARVRAWYAEVARVVAPHLAPAGPVVAIGVDHQAQMFFRLGAYDHDYHPDAIAWWNEATGLDGPPPRAWPAAGDAAGGAEAARCVAWVRFKDQYVARALGELATMLDEVGLAGIARFHDLPPGHPGLYDLRRIQHAIGGPVGIEAASPREEFRDLRRRATALVGNAAPVPIAFGVGVGASPWLPPLDPPSQPAARDPVRPAGAVRARGTGADRERDQVLTLLAAGVRGFTLVSAVERARYYGAAITAEGALEPHAAWIRPLVQALGEVDWPSLHRRAPIALVETRADARFGIASSVLDPMTPVLVEALKLGPGGAAELGTDPGAIAARRWQTAIASALELAQVPYAIVDESAPEDELARYRAVIVPTGDRVDRGLWQRACALAEHRRAIVVIGPGTPARDELGQPLAGSPPRRVGRLQEGSLEDLAGLAGDLADLAGELSDAWHVERPEEVRAMAFADPQGHVRVVFVASDRSGPQTAILLTGETAKALRDPFSGERLRVTGGRATIPLPARGIRMLIVE